MGPWQFRFHIVYTINEIMPVKINRFVHYLWKPWLPENNTPLREYQHFHREWMSRKPGAQRHGRR